MEGRSGSKENYSYGFNGMEKDDEVKGQGNSYTTEFRQYDPRLGRWLSLDPLAWLFADESPYVGFANNPIYFVDPSGLSPGPGDPIKVNKTSRDPQDVSSEATQLPVDPTDGQTQVFNYRNGDKSIWTYSAEYDKWGYEFSLVNNRGSISGAGSVDDELFYTVSAYHSQAWHDNKALEAKIVEEFAQKTTEEGNFLVDHSTKIGIGLSLAEGTDLRIRSTLSGRISSAYRYNQVTTPVHALGKRIDVSSRLLRGVGTFTKTVAKNAPILSLGITAWDIYDQRRVTAGHVFSTGTTVAALAAGGPVGWGIGAGYLILQGASYLISERSLEENLNALWEWSGLGKDGTILSFGPGKLDIASMALKMKQQAKLD